MWATTRVALFQRWMSRRTAFEYTFCLWHLLDLLACFLMKYYTANLGDVEMKMGQQNSSPMQYSSRSPVMNVPSPSDNAELPAR